MVRVRVRERQKQRQRQNDKDRKKNTHTKTNTKANNKENTNTKTEGTVFEGKMFERMRDFSLCRGGGAATKGREGRRARERPIDNRCAQTLEV